MKCLLCAWNCVGVLGKTSHTFLAWGDSLLSWRKNKMSQQNRCSAAAAAAASLQSCLTLCDPIDGSPPGSSVHGILQARTLEWVAISSSNAWKWKVKVKSLSHVRLLATAWTAAYQAPLSMGFSRQEYWSGVPLPSPNRCPRGAQLDSETSQTSTERLLILTRFLRNPN